MKFLSQTELEKNGADKNQIKDRSDNSEDKIEEKSTQLAQRCEDIGNQILSDLSQTDNDTPSENGADGSKDSNSKKLKTEDLFKSKYDPEPKLFGSPDKIRRSKIDESQLKGQISGKVNQIDEFCDLFNNLKVENDPNSQDINELKSGVKNADFEGQNGQKANSENDISIPIIKRSSSSDFGFIFDSKKVSPRNPELDQSVSNSVNGKQPQSLASQDRDIVHAVEDSTPSTQIKQSEFECTICFCLMAQPCKLPCGHFFCIHCLEKQFKIIYQCPLDRQAIPNDFELKVDVEKVEVIRQNHKIEYGERLHELLKEGLVKNFTFKTKIKDLVRPIAEAPLQPVLPFSSEISSDDDYDDDYSSQLQSHRVSNQYLQGSKRHGMGQQFNVEYFDVYGDDCYRCGRRGHWANRCPQRY